MKPRQHKSKLTQFAQEKSDFELRTMSKDSLAWLKKKILGLQTGARIANPITREPNRFVTKFGLGQLYCFYYDPKGKNELPYYDTFPLSLVLEKYNDGFLGLNFHYLPLRYRIVFLEKLMDTAVLDANNGVMRLRVTYDILNATKRFTEFKPCIKRYLLPHIKSRIIAIQPNEFDVAAFLPIYQFKKAKPEQVWEESMQKAKISDEEDDE